MPEMLAQALAVPGLGWIVFASLVAGLVYGFAGFGAALFFMPVATIFIPPEMAVAAFSLSAIASAVTVLPAAVRECDGRATVVLIAAAAVTAPIGIWLLTHTDATFIRWGVSIVVAATLVALIAGWRYVGRPHNLTRAAIGAATGVLGGATGLVGPIVIVFNLGSQDSITLMRANTMVFLTTVSLLLLPLLAFQGALHSTTIWLGIVLLAPYGIGNVLGKMLFNPERQSLYRGIAFAIIGGAVIAGLPIYH